MLIIDIKVMNLDKKNIYVFYIDFKFPKVYILYSIKLKYTQCYLLKNDMPRVINMARPPGLGEKANLSRQAKQEKNRVYW